jgi:phosphoserine phosphatase RsbU/P
MPESQNSPADAQSTRRKGSRGGERLREFWRHVTEGIELEQLWSQFAADARESYGLYSREVDWAALQQVKPLKRVFLAAWALFHAMLMKLSPARRVLLLLAVALLLIQPSFRWGNSQVNIQFGGWGAVLLFLLLALELADRVTMKRDLEIAREIQHLLVPEKPPEVPGVDIAFATRPANTVAGDYYDAFLRPADGGGQRLLLVVADVAGKSVPAALLMATFQASLQALAAMPTTLAEVVDGLNRYSCAHSLGGRRFTTAFFAEFDPVTKLLNYINAGHNAPILRRASGEVLRLEAGGLPLGIPSMDASGSRYESGDVRLAANDCLVVFTDGVIEAINESDEDFGEPRLLGAVNEARSEPAAATLARLMGDVERFVGSARQHDDITCLVMRAAVAQT